MVAYSMPQQRRKKEESDRLRGERDQIKFTDLGFERWQIVWFNPISKSIMKSSHQGDLPAHRCPSEILVCFANICLII